MFICEISGKYKLKVTCVKPSYFINKYPAGSESLKLYLKHNYSLNKNKKMYTYDNKSNNKKMGW